MITEALGSLIERQDLSPSAMESAMDALFEGRATPAQIGAFLVALRMKGETVDELAAAARAMRRHALPVALDRSAPILDTCGTGGDRSGTFNISTVAAIVVSACGVTVAKHGNRAATSQSGSADLLEALGVSLERTPEQIARSIQELGIGFMFARVHHPAMRHVAPVRTEIGVRTLFNFLGPLSNPAGATHQLVGVGDPSRLHAMAEVLGRLGSQAAWVVHGDGGLDEVALSGPTRVAALRNGQLRSFELRPDDFGVASASLAALRGGDARHNAGIARAILEGEVGPRRDAVLINAAAALCVVEAVETPREGVERAARAIDSGAAREKLAAWAAFEA